MRPDTHLLAAAEAAASPQTDEHQNTINPVKERYDHCTLNKLTVSDLNVRKTGTKDIADLKANIRENGLISRVLSVVPTQKEGHTPSLLVVAVYAP